MASPFRRVFARILCAGLAVLAGAAALAQPQEPPASHPFTPSRQIPGRYIIVFKDTVANPAAEAANALRGLGGQLHHTYSEALKGFAATLPHAALQGLLNNPAISYIEPDQSVSLTGSQTLATWGLDRIDQASRPLDNYYNYDATGSGVYAFIIDTGIRADHLEFTGRLIEGHSVIADGRGTNDCDGHGTHVAGTVGGTTWGVAKQVRLSPVRVLDCRGSGTISGVIAGIDWVAGRTDLRPAVANMSLGAGKSTSLNAAVSGAVGKTVTMVVAAGNSSADACNYSPSSEPSAITVGATNSSDARSSYSNYGTCVDLFAPGSSITSAGITSNNASNTLSGTSMASPHAAGVAALALQANPGASPAAIANFLAAHATAGILGSVGTGSPNRLLFSRGTGVATEPPTVEIAVSNISGTSYRKGKNWRAQATVTVVNVSQGAPMANVTVSGSFAPPGSTGSCVTASNGSCTLTSGPIDLGIERTMFAIGTVSGASMVWKSNYWSAQFPIGRP